MINKFFFLSNELALSRWKNSREILGNTKETGSGIFRK